MRGRPFSGRLRVIASVMRATAFVPRRWKPQ
jgi:hypothetical protein